VENMEEELDYYYKNGFKGGDKIGEPGFDALFSFRRGELTTITGIPGSGKSAKLDDWLVKLSSRHGWKHGVCSPENQPVPLHVSKLASCFIGKPFYRANPNARMSETEWNFAKYFINENFFFFNIAEVEMSIDGVLSKGAELVMRYGIDSLVIDPWNTLDHTLGGMSETQFISKSLTKITNFAKTYSIHIFLVAHPTKIGKDKNTGKYEIPNLYSISGSAHFFNKTDNGITVYRDFETNVITVYVQKVRFFFVGRIGYIGLIYDVETGRYCEENNDFVKESVLYSRRIGFELPITPEPIHSPTLFT
jgi:twinkle protein